METRLIYVCSIIIQLKLAYSAIYFSVYHLKTEDQIMKIYLFSILLFFGTSLSAQQDNDLKLWYKTPSGTVWENALPIGNGFQGAMVYGNVEKEIFQLNEASVWSGSPNRNDNPDAKQALDEIRKLLFQKEYKKAEKLINENIITKKSHGQMFQPVGNLELHFLDHHNFTDYYRELDIEKAVTKTTYKTAGVTYTRETFMSFPDRVLVIKLTADKPGKLSFTADFTSEHKKQEISVNGNNELSLSGTTSDHEGVEGKVNFNALAKFKIKGGRTTANGNSIQIEDADSVLIYVAIASNFINYKDISGNEKQASKSFLDRAFDKSYDKMKKTHIEYYQKYFKRVQLDLGITAASKLPTDERLANFRNVSDPSFVTLYYQYGRYLLISSSQPGGQPANLQGIWNHSMNPAWDSKYTININTEMNYWPAEKTNLSEMHEPLLKMITELAATGKETASVMYGARGWMAHHNTDIWRINGAVDGATWGVWNAGGGWLSQHLWEHYL
jgi:alpha-L-fucosidase 2